MKYSPEFIADFKYYIYEKDSESKIELDNKIAYILSILKKSTYDCINTLYHEKKESDRLVMMRKEINSLLNKLAENNYDIMLNKILKLRIDNYKMLSVIMEVMFHKVIKEPYYSQLYGKLAKDINDKCNWIFNEEIKEYNSKINKVYSVRIILLEFCQKKFEEIITNKLEYEETNLYFKEKNERLGTLSLIAELYKNNLLAHQVIHQCITVLINDPNNEINIELLIQFLTILNDKLKNDTNMHHIYFDILSNYYNNSKMSSRVKFAILDFIELNKKNNTTKNITCSNIEDKNITCSNIEDKIIKSYLLNKDFNTIKDLLSDKLSKDNLLNILDIIFDLSDSDINNCIILLNNLLKYNYIDKNILMISFDEFEDELDDMMIDIPNAKDIFKKLKVNLL